MKWILSAVIDAPDLETALDRAGRLPCSFRPDLPDWVRSYDLRSFEPLEGRLRPTAVRVVNNG